MADGNVDNLSPMIPINISHDPGKIENVYIGAGCSPDEIKEYINLFIEFRDISTWSYEEMSSIEPCIVEHEIKTYPDAKPVWQCLCVVNPRKALAIKAEIEKLLKDGLNYPVPLTEWISNPISVDNK